MTETYSEPFKITVNRNLLAWALLTTAPMSVLADLPGHWYASAGVGWNHAANVKFNEMLDESPGETGATIDLDFGAPVWSASLGLALNNAWRVELEAAYRHNDTEILFFANSGREVHPDPVDEVEATSLLVNLLRDFELGTALQPYVGVGLGVARLDYRVGETALDGSVIQRPRRPIIDDRATSLAFQLIAGFTMPLSRRLDLAADYRYWRAPSVKLKEATGRELDTDYAANSVWLSLRYRARAHDQGRAGWSTTTERMSPAPPSGLYIAGQLGAGFAVDAEISDNRANFDAFDLGGVATLAVGYRLNDRWRFELEAAHRKNAVEIIDFNPEFGEDRATGAVRANSLMANAIYRFHPQSVIAPYTGFGAGLVWADYDVNVRGSKFIDDDDSALAAQVIVGVDIAVSPRVTFSADYRFWLTAKLKMEQPDGRPLHTHQMVHSVTVGLRCSLAKPR